MRRTLGFLTAWIAPRRAAAAAVAEMDGYRDAHKRLLDERERHEETKILLAKAEADLEVMKVRLDGMAACVAQYHSQFEAIARINGMKGQPPNVSDLPFAGLSQ